MSYEYIYLLKPKKEVEPGWWKLRWRPIKHRGIDEEGTWNLYKSKNFKSGRSIGMYLYQSGAHNGWNRSWDGIVISIHLWFYTIEFWVKYNIIVHEDGPGDVSDEDKRPLDMPKRD